MQRLFLRLKHCNGENENECKNFHDVAGWSRVLERRPPDRKTSMQWEKITKLQCQKSVPQWHDFFKKNNKNNTEFLGAETAKKGCSLR